jgi:hypothetical protein
VFERGQRVGEQARGEFPGGVLVDREPWQIAEKVADTRAALDTGAPAIFEASFLADGVFAAVDVLERCGDHHVLVEVKSTFGVKPQFIPDVAVQLHVARGSGVPVDRAEVMHLTRDRARERNAVKFVREDVTGAVESFLPSVGGHLERMRAALGGNLPNVERGAHCREPYECPFLPRCGGSTSERTAQPCPSR